MVESAKLNNAENGECSIKGGKSTKIKHTRTHIHAYPQSRIGACELAEMY